MWRYTVDPRGFGVCSMDSECDGCGNRIVKSSRRIYADDWHSAYCFCSKACEDQWNQKPASTVTATVKPTETTKGRLPRNSKASSGR